MSVASAVPGTASVVDLGRMEYGAALALQERLVDLRQKRLIGDVILLVEHPPVLTLGVRGSRSNILATPATLARAGVSIFPVNRGGDVTYHGPGQLVGYPILDLPALELGVREYVRCIEDAVIRLLDEDYGLTATHADQKYTGVWLGNDKICAIGIAVQHGVSMHGFAFNVAPDLSHFDWIVPCGLTDRGITSIARETGRPVRVDEVRARVAEVLCQTLGLSPTPVDKAAFLASLPSGDAVAAPLPPHPDPAPTPAPDPTPEPAPAPEPDVLHKPDFLRKPDLLRKPDWLRIKAAPESEGQAEVYRLVGDLGLHTVCEEAACPNKRECFGRRTATFLVLGDVCTRDCTFCAVERGCPQPPDPTEPARVAEAVHTLGLRHAVITSVTRDDLPDGGASHFAQLVHEIRTHSPETTVELLIPDFKGEEQALDTVLDALPDVLNHNVETVPRLYPEVRPSARYARSLELLRRASTHPSHVRTKSGIMVGLGETQEEVLEVFSDLRDAGVSYLTVGQYLAPSREHHPVVEYVPPEVFDLYKEKALGMGFRHVASGPFVRSSYHAEEALE